MKTSALIQLDFLDLLRLGVAATPAVGEPASSSTVGIGPSAGTAHPVKVVTATTFADMTAARATTTAAVSDTAVTAAVTRAAAAAMSDLTAAQGGVDPDSPPVESVVGTLEAMDAVGVAAAVLDASLRTSSTSTSRSICEGRAHGESDAPGGPEAGTANEVSVVHAARQWGVSRDAVVALVANGFIDGGFRRVGDRKHYHVVVCNWKPSLRGRFAAYQDTDPPLPDVAAFRRFDEIRIKTHVTDLSVSDHWIKSYFRLPDRYVGHDYPMEIRGLLTANDEEIGRISRLLQMMADDGRLYAGRVPCEAGDLRERLISALSYDVPPLIFTWLGPNGWKLPAIDAAAGARLLSMPPGRRRDRAIVHAASAAANGEMIQLSVQALSHARTAVILDGVDDDDEAAIEARWTSFLKGELLEEVGRSAVIRTFHDEMACERTFCAYAEEPVPDALRNWLESNMPLMPRDPAFWELVRDTVEYSVAGGDAKRKCRTDVISDAFDDHAAEAVAALAEAMAMFEGVAAGHAAAGASAAYEFSFPMPVRDAARRETGATMLVDMVSFRGDALVELLLDDAKSRGEELTPKSFLRRHASGGDRRDSTLETRRFAVYVGVEAVGTADGRAEQPSMMETFRTGAGLPPGMLPSDVVAARRRHLAERGLPVPSLRPKGLVIGRDVFERNLMTWGLRSGIVIYPSEAFVQGCSIGSLFYRCSVANQARGGTALQMVDDRSGFGSRPDETGRRRPFYWAIPKLGGDVAAEHMLDDETPEAFKAHIGLTLRIEGVGDRPDAERTRLEVVDPSSDHPPSCIAARYAFQAAGRALIVGDVNYCLSHLFGRLVLTHDPRHGGANRRKQEGETSRQVADALGNRSVSVSAGYSRDTPAQIRAKGGGRFISIRDAQAKLGVASR